MNDDANSLAALLGTRICHDLISPIGAIGNGLELLSLEGGRGPELSLVSDSLGSAQARIRFYRIAFGVAGRDQSVPRNDARAILHDLYAGSRMKVDWAVADSYLRAETKLAFLLILCCEAAMPRGGRVLVERSAVTWRLSTEAAAFRELEDMWSLLGGPARSPSVGADMIQFPLAALQAADLGRTISVDRSDGRLRITV